MSGQSFGFFSAFFSSSSATTFCTLCKTCHKTQTYIPVKLEFGTLKGFIKADLSTKFGGNLIKDHGVMTDYFA